MKLNKDNCCLLVIDIQQKLIDHIFDKSTILNENLKLVEFLTIMKVPIVYSEQYPKGLGKTLDVLEKKIQCSEFTKIEKTSFSVAENECFMNFLKKKKISQIIISGIESHICVLQTAIDLLNKEYNVYLVAESIGSRKRSHKELAFKRILKEGGTLINFEMLFFELIKDSQHSNFKELSNSYIK